MNISPELIPIFWGALGLVGLAAVSLGVGITLLLGTAISHRRVALPMIWISASLLVAGTAALIIVLSHS
jgi:hypothetical protein